MYLTINQNVLPQRQEHECIKKIWEVDRPALPKIRWGNIDNLLKFNLTPVIYTNSVRRYLM